MELRHLEAALAVAEAGSFTAAADRLATVQSNVSEQIRQLEAELGAELFVRSRRGAVPTECGEVVLERARRIRRELDALRGDLSMLQGLEVGDAVVGVVGTASRWLVPALVADLRNRAPGIHLRVVEGASERLVAEVVAGAVAQAVVTEPVVEARVIAETVLQEAMVGVVPDGVRVRRGPVSLAELSDLGLVLPPSGNPLRDELDALAATHGLGLDVTVEVEGIRLIADLVASGAGASVLPETALPADLEGVQIVGVEGLPPRRLAVVRARDAYLSIADRAVRDAVLRLVGGFERPPAHRSRRSGSPRSTTPRT